MDMRVGGRKDGYRHLKVESLNVHFRRAKAENSSKHRKNKENSYFIYVCSILKSTLKNHKVHFKIVNCAKFKRNKINV